MISFKAVILPLSAALGLSLAVERILEFLQNLFERSIGMKGVRKIPVLSGLDKKLKELEELHQKAQDTQEGEWEEQVPANIILVKKAQALDHGKTLKTLILQLLGVAAGILLARFCNVHLFNKFLELINIPLIPLWADYAFTGLLIGGGSEPIHVLIRFISERKITAEAEPIAEEEKLPQRAEKPAAPAMITKSSDLKAHERIDIPYSGGIDLDQLEDVHRRKKDPDLIVYHHTAMSSRSSFEDVVHVIKGRNWLTGYNCVIQADGSICPFCRWDRYGNHAKGYNLGSLGIAFNGNYETDPKVPYSNPAGKYGPPRPTEDQLKAGARVVTLWTFLYHIKVDFKERIIPHNKISSKTCPGSMFPYEEFRKWIEFYRNHWDKSSAVQDQIKAFDLKPYLHV